MNHFRAESTRSQGIDPADFGPVLRSLRRALALDSTNARAWQYLGMTRAETGDFAGGLAEWRRSVTVDPAYTEGLAFLALGYNWQREHDSAGRWADSAVTLDPNYLFGRTAVGYIAIERGDYDRGVAAFEAARRLTNDVKAVNSEAGAARSHCPARRERSVSIVNQLVIAVRRVVVAGPAIGARR